MTSPAAKVALGVFLVAAAGPAGFLMYRLVFSGRLPAHPSQVTAPSAPQRAPTAAAPAAGAGSAPGSPLPAEATRAVPDAVPDIALPDAQGKMRRLAEWRGRPLLINFWATWCEPCRREIPLLKRLRHDETAPGLEVVGIAVDMRAPVLKYARDMGIDYPVLIGDEDGLKAVDAFGMQAVLPFSVFADREGHIVALKIGELHPDDAQLILSRVHEVDEGRVSLPAAKQQIASGLSRLAVERAKQGQPAVGDGSGKS